MATLVVETRERLKRKRRAVRRTQERLHKDIRLAHQYGVGATRLAKISGYSVSRIYQILGQ